MNTCALGSAANDGAWQPAAATGLPAVAGWAAGARPWRANVRQNIRRSGVYCFARVSRLRGPDPHPEFWSLVFCSDRVAVDVSLPLSVPLALFIVGCDSSCRAIRSHWRGSALARLRRVALGRAASNGLGTPEDGKRKHWTLRCATFLVRSSETFLEPPVVADAVAVQADGLDRWLGASCPRRTTSSLSVEASPAWRDPDHAAPERTTASRACGRS
jgi:hypothetical protein